MKRTRVEAGPAFAVATGLMVLVLCVCAMIASMPSCTTVKEITEAELVRMAGEVAVAYGESDENNDGKVDKRERQEVFVPKLRSILAGK